MNPEHTSRWVRTRRNRGRYKRQNAEGSSRFLRSAVSIIDTNAAPPEKLGEPLVATGVVCRRMLQRPIRVRPKGPRRKRSDSAKTFRKWISASHLKLMGFTRTTGGISGKGVLDISAPSMPKSPGTFLQSGRRPGEERRKRPA